MRLPRATHLPHYRQSRRSERQHDAKIGRATLSGLTRAAARHLAAIIAEPVRATYLQVDEWSASDIASHAPTT